MLPVTLVYIYIDHMGETGFSFATYMYHRNNIDLESLIESYCF